MLTFLPVFVPQAPDLKATYSKAEYDVPMRDGVTLHTVVYSPKSVAGKPRYCSGP